LFVPANYQRALPLERLILEEAPAADAIELDVLFVGAGPAGLAGAIELARLARQDSSTGELSIGVLEKAKRCVTTRIAWRRSYSPAANARCLR
jgi:cation diffusion facilitator CzcD-associated flavoprotein CzcO